MPSNKKYCIRHIIRATRHNLYSMVRTVCHTTRQMILAYYNLYVFERHGEEDEPCVRIVINIIVITIIVMFDRSRGMQNDVTKRKIARACARVRTEIFAYTYICSRDRVNDTQREKNNKKETHTHAHKCIHIMRCT